MTLTHNTEIYEPPYFDAVGNGGEYKQLNVLNLPALVWGTQFTEGNLPTPMQKTTANGRALFTNGNLGADLIHLAPGEQFELHTHPGDHLLYIVKGKGTVVFGERMYDTREGDFYMVPGNVPHGVGTRNEHHYILAIGSPHSRIDSTERMAYVCPECTRAHHGTDMICEECGIERYHFKCIGELHSERCESYRATL